MKLNIQLFASGTIDGTSTASNATCRIVWTSTPNNEENYSIVTAEVQLYKSGSSSTTGTFSGVVNINDIEYSISKKFSPYRWGNWATVGTISATVYHNPNGTKDVNISTYFYNNGTSMAGDYSTPYPNYVTLDTIPRNSEFNTTIWNTTQRDTPRTMNTTLSFPAIQNVANVYHKLEARFMNNGTETTICTRTGVVISGGYISFTLSNAEQQAIYNLMPNETTHYIRMYLYTYTDSSYQDQLGDVSIIWWTGLIPTSVVPSASFASYTEGGDVPSNWGVWVKNKSKVNFTLSGTGIYGSTISSYSLSGDGVTYYTNPTLTNYLSSSGNITFTGTTTDSRNRQGSATLTLNVEDYYNPTIATAQVQRCDIDGNIDRNGEYVFISYGGSISSCSNKNTPNAIYKVGYKTTTSDTYTYITLASNTNSYSATGMLYTDGIYAADRGSGSKLQLSSDYTYDIQFYVKDYFAINDDNVQVLDTGLDLLNFNASGKSMAIGKVSEAAASDELLEIALDTKIEGKLTTPNVELMNTTPYIDFHYDNSTSDYTSRIIETSSGTLTMDNNLAVNGQIQLGSNGFKTFNGGGYSVDQYGNLKHLQSSTSNNWQWQDYNGSPRGQFYFDTGVLALNNRNVATMKELYNDTTGSQSIDIGESTSNYNMYVIVWGTNYNEKRTDIFIPNFGNIDLSQYATTGYNFVYTFSNSGNTISMAYKQGSGWGDSGKINKIIGIKF